MSSFIICCDVSGWALIEYILFCHVLWWIFYYFLLTVTRQSEEWCCRFLTLFHGCLISYSAIRDILTNESSIDFQCIPLSQEKRNYLSYMLSYFLYDFCWIHFFGNEAWIIYAHHVASVLIITNVLVKNYGGSGVSYGVAGLELTNPYLQLRWFLRSHGYLNKPIHTITELWFMFLFFIIRVVGGTVLLYYALVQSKPDYAMQFSFLSIYGISLVLQWQIFVYFRKKYLGTRNLRNVNLINSTVSLSPYFQRRTLDHHDYLDRTSEEDNNDGAPAKNVDESPSNAVVVAVPSTRMASFSTVDTTEYSSAKMSQSSLKAAESPTTELPSTSANPRAQTPKGERSEASLQRRESSKKGSTANESEKNKQALE